MPEGVSSVPEDCHSQPICYISSRICGGEKVALGTTAAEESKAGEKVILLLEFHGG